MKNLIKVLLVLVAMTANHVFAETYVYTGKPFAIKLGQYSTASEPWVTGFIRTELPIPPNSSNFDLRPMNPVFSFSDGVQTITNENGEFHPTFSTRISTDGAGNITRADIWIGDSPIGTEVGAMNNTIQTSFSTNFDVGLVQGTCTIVSDSICTSYSFGPDRGLLLNTTPGPWTIFIPDREHTGMLPSGKIGIISFTTDDPNCTFAEDPKFLPVEDANPPPPDEVDPIDGLVQFSIESCADGATVTISVDYVLDLPADAEYWKVGKPWFPLESTVEGSIIEFSITDGGLGDGDGVDNGPGVINGQIVDPGGASIADIFSDGFESE